MTEKDNVNQQNEDSGQDVAKRLSSAEYALEIALSKEDSDGGSVSGKNDQSLADAMDTPNMTDMQATLHRLFPQFSIGVINKVAQTAMVARISEEVFLDLVYLNVTSIVEQMDADGEEEDIDVQAIIDLVYFAFSIGLGGKGRVDGLELAGAAKDAELDKLSKGLGL